MFAGKALGALGDKVNVGTLFEYRASRAYRIQQPLDAPYASGLEACAVHDERVQLYPAIAIENRSTSGVKGFIVLQRGDRLFHRVQRRSAALQHPPTGGGSPFDALLMRLAGLVRNGPRATMHHDDRRRQVSPQPESCNATEYHSRRPANAQDYRRQ